MIQRHTLTSADGLEVLFRHLRRDKAGTTRDLGEDEAIALLLTELPDLVFVTQDRAAAVVALAELGPSRVATPFDVWEWMRSQGMITADEFGALCERTIKSCSGLFPGRPWRLGHRH